MFRKSSAWGWYLHTISVCCQCFSSLLDWHILLHIALHNTHLSSLIRVSAWAFPLLHKSFSGAAHGSHLLTTHKGCGGAAEDYTRKARQGVCSHGPGPQRGGAIAGKTSAPSANSREVIKTLLRNTEPWESQECIR